MKLEQKLRLKRKCHTATKCQKQSLPIRLPHVPHVGSHFVPVLAPHQHLYLQSVFSKSDSQHGLPTHPAFGSVTVCYSSSARLLLRPRRGDVVSGSSDKLKWVCYMHTFITLQPHFENKFYQSCGIVTLL